MDWSFRLGLLCRYTLAVGINVEKIGLFTLDCLLENITNPPKKLFFYYKNVHVYRLANKGKVTSKKKKKTLFCLLK